MAKKNVSLPQVGDIVNLKGTTRQGEYEVVKVDEPYYVYLKSTERENDRVCYGVATFNELKKS